MATQIPDQSHLHLEPKPVHGDMWHRIAYGFVIFFLIVIALAIFVYRKEISALYYNNVSQSQTK